MIDEKPCPFPHIYDAGKCCGGTCPAPTGDVGELVTRHQTNLGRFISRTEAELHRETIAALTAQAAHIAELERLLSGVQHLSQEATISLRDDLAAAEARLAECERTRRYDLQWTDYGVMICRGEHEKYEDHEYEHYYNADDFLAEKRRADLTEARLAECERERDAATARAERLEAALRKIAGRRSIIFGGGVMSGHEAFDIASAALADSAPTPAPDAGYVLVPREPTHAMRVAAFNTFEIDNPKQYSNGTAARDAIYRAMIEASQQGGDKT